MKNSKVIRLKKNKIEASEDPEISSKSIDNLSKNIQEIYFDSLKKIDELLDDKLIDHK